MWKHSMLLFCMAFCRTRNWGCKSVVTIDTKYNMLFKEPLVYKVTENHTFYMTPMPTSVRLFVHMIQGVVIFRLLSPKRPPRFPSMSYLIICSRNHWPACSSSWSAVSRPIHLTPWTSLPGNPADSSRSIQMPDPTCRSLHRRAPSWRRSGRIQR